jgi:hypothetical protein
VTSTTTNPELTITTPAQVEPLMALYRLMLERDREYTDALSKQFGPWSAHMMRYRGDYHNVEVRRAARAYHAAFDAYQSGYDKARQGIAA